MPLPIRYSEAGRGWDSNFVAFAATKPSAVLRKLNDFVTHASHQEISSWQASVPHLQREVDETIRIDAESGQYTAILEYRLPLEMRRVDALFLLHDRIVVIELKGKELPSEADIDQAHAYARDLRYYHRECHDREVKAVVIPHPDGGEALFTSWRGSMPAPRSGLLYGRDQYQGLSHTGEPAAFSVR